MLLKARDITKTYKNTGSDDLMIFKNLNFEIDNEKIVTIYGPSGVGKSTFLNILGTVDKPDSGKVELNKIMYNSSSYTEIRKKYISYMFQFHYLLPEFTVYDNLEIVLSIKKISKINFKETILETLERFGIADKKSYYPHQLSGGERQRVSLARAVINSPLIVLADEPTGNLDNENSYMVAEEIRKIAYETNIKFIIATHDSIFQKISDKIYKIKKMNIFDMKK